MKFRGEGVKRTSNQLNLNNYEILLPIGERKREDYMENYGVSEEEDYEEKEDYEEEEEE